eukprot:Clim_evm1s128 gene=Clim_evmTU1s128
MPPNTDANQSLSSGSGEGYVEIADVYKNAPNQSKNEKEFDDETMRRLRAVHSTDSKRSSKRASKLDIIREKPFYVTFEDIKCEIGGKEILKGISGFCQPGESLAIVGASGAGKTTLMDIVLSRKNMGNFSGTTLYNGRELTPFLKKKLGYVAAECARVPTLTVRETLMFAAELRLPENFTKDMREDRVNDIMDHLGLTHVADNKVGNELVRGISTGEKRRVDIALELIPGPRVLFLDEPTSGLDSHIAEKSMSLVLNFCRDHNVTVISVIHQPSSNVFLMFDNVMLLGQGRTQYFGGTREAEEYFTSQGYPLPADTNPIDHYVEIVDKDPHTLADAFEQSEHIKRTADTIADIKALQNPEGEKDMPTKELRERTVLAETEILCRKITLRYLRNPNTSWVRVLFGLVIAWIYGMAFYKLTPDLNGFRLIGNLCSLLAFLSAFITAASVPQFQDDRDVMLQENALGYYSIFAYWASYWMLENFVTLLTMAGAVPIVYFMAGFQQEFGRFYGMALYNSMVAVSIAQFASAWSRDTTMAFTLNVLINFTGYLFSGIPAAIELIPAIIRWGQYLTNWRFAVMYMLYTQLVGFQLDCSEAEFLPLNVNTIIPPVVEGTIATLTPNVVSDPNDLDLAAPGLGATLQLQGVSEVFVELNENGTLPSDYAQSFFLASTFWLNSTSQYLVGEYPYTAQLQNYAVINSLGQIESLAEMGFFPDYSQCLITDTGAFIEAKFPLPIAYGDYYFGFVSIYLVFYSVTTYFGLHFSKYYKRR